MRGVKAAHGAARGNRGRCVDPAHRVGRDGSGHAGTVGIGNDTARSRSVWTSTRSAMPPESAVTANSPPQIDAQGATADRGGVLDIALRKKSAIIVWPSSAGACADSVIVLAACIR